MRSRRAGKQAAYKLHPILKRWLSQRSSPEEIAVTKIRKIDSRNALYGQFKWQIRLNTERFLDVRDWCQQTWGPTVEYIWFGEYGVKRNCIYWYFNTEYTNRKKDTAVIYLRDDPELGLFQLKWG